MKKTLIILIGMILALCAAFSTVQAVNLSACVPVIGVTSYNVVSTASGSCEVTLNTTWNSADDLAAALPTGTELLVTNAGSVSIAGISSSNGDVRISAAAGTNLTITGAISAPNGDVIFQDVPGNITINNALTDLITVGPGRNVRIKSASIVMNKDASKNFAVRTSPAVPLIMDERSVIDVTSGDTKTISVLLLPALTVQSAKAGEVKDYNLSTYSFDLRLGTVTVQGYTLSGPPVRTSPLFNPGIYDVVVNFNPAPGTSVFGPGGGAAIKTMTFPKVWRIDPANIIGGIEFYPIFNERDCGFGRECHRMPCTGFPANIHTRLRAQPTELAYTDLKLSLEIPTLSVSADLVGVPEESESWAVEWLQDRAGVLAGSSLPGEGYSFIAAHNHLNTSQAGPFIALGNLEKSDLIFVRKADGSLQKFTVYANELLKAEDIDTMTAIALQEADSMVLITCENQASDGSYLNRRVVFTKPM